MDDEYILELEDIKEKDRLWCISRYNELIMNALDRVLDNNILSEKHHIIPKCLGGSNKFYNLVRLTYREHTLAHVLLSHIYPTNPKLWIAAALLLGVEKKYVNGKLTIVKNFLTIEEASKYREKAMILGLKKNQIFSEETRKNMSIAQRNKFSKLTKEERSAIYGKHGKDHYNFGKHHSDETKKKISLSNKGKHVNKSHITSEYREKLSKAHKGIPKSEEHKRKLSESLKGRIISEESIKKRVEKIKGRKHTEEHKKKISEGLLKSRLNNPCLKKVQGPDGTIYNSMRECSEAVGHDRHVILKWIRNNPEKGYKFINEEDNN